LLISKAFTPENILAKDRGSVSLHHIVGLCHPLPTARFIVFYAFDNKSTSEPHAQGPGYFYGTIRLERAEDPQTILAL
jgi:DMSO/TMAO reductase YedYZ molybdopterin-dependent catalytic subunit